MILRRFHPVYSLLLIITLARPAEAIQQLEEVRSPQNSTPEVRTIQQDLKPAFLIQPLVNRLQGRRGTLLTFSFDIEAHNRPTRLLVEAVAMTQQENGVIQPDDEAPAPEAVELTSPSVIRLSTNESQRIEGRIRIPPGNTPFLSYGILVTEQPEDNNRSGEDDEQARVGIRFVTRYLLRIDVDVLGVSGDSVRELVIPAALLTEQNGSALARAFVENPTDTPLEFELKARLSDAQTGRETKAFGLVVPVRASQPEPNRYITRILPGARLRMEDVLPHPVFAGRYTMHLQMLWKGRRMQEVEFPIEISPGEFPAQDASIVRVTRDITIEPTNAELSLRRGGTRTQAMTVTNNSLQAAQFRFRPLGADDSEAAWFRVRPDNFELPPGRSRRVLIMTGGILQPEDHLYGFAELSVTPEDGTALGRQRIPVALLVSSDKVGPPQIAARPLEWEASPDRAGFRLPVRNTGGRHIPLDARLMLVDEFGRGFAVRSGFGKWLLPGQEENLWFGFRQIPPPGRYQLQGQILMPDSVPPVSFRQEIRIERNLVPTEADEEAESAARETNPVR